MTGMENEISSKIEKVFHDVFGIDFDSLPEDARSKSLVSENYYFGARDLLTLLVKLEEEFKIEIPEQRIKNGEFNSFHNIERIISAQVNWAEM